MEGTYAPITDKAGNLVPFNVGIEGQFGDNIERTRKAFAAINPVTLDFYLFLEGNKTLEIKLSDLENVSQIDMSQGNSGLLLLLKKNFGKVKIYGISYSALLAYGHFTKPYILT